MTFAPVRIARSSIVSCLVGPNPGKSTTFTFMLPLTLLASNAAIGCCSALATINKLLFDCITNSNTLCILRMLGIGEDTISTYGFSSIAFPLSLSVIKCGDLSPQFILVPSTNLTYVSWVSDSSIRTTPSFPTFE